MQIPTILIAGAGPTGMTAALELTRFGIPVRIVDKIAAPSTTSRALAVQARTLELFEQRGLTESMLKLGNKVSVTRIYSEAKPLFSIELSRIASRYNFILMLSQAETERILREELSRLGVEIERPLELVAIAQTEGNPNSAGSGNVRAVLKHPNGTLEEMETPYLIAAEGAHSSVRHTLNLPFAGHSLDQQYLLGDLHVDGPVSDTELAMHLSRHGFLGFFPMGNRHFRLIASEPLSEEAKQQAEPGVAKQEPSLEDLQQLLDLYSGIPARLYDMTWSSRFRINTRMLKTLQDGRIFFGGDSGHVHSPAGGQGMNTGIQDMIDLCWKLAFVLQGKANPRLLETYGEDRLPAIREVLQVTEQMTHAAQGDSQVVHQLLMHFAPIFFETNLAQQKSTSTVSQIAVNYRTSTLSKSDAHPGSLRAGDRVPEMHVTVHPTGSGQPLASRLLSLLDPLRFTLLITGRAFLDTSALEPWHALINPVRITAAEEDEAAEAFETAFGTQPGLYLVRPDSYLGLVGASNSGSALLDWVNHWLSPGACPAISR